MPIGSKEMYDKRDSVLTWMTNHGLPQRQSYEFPFASDFTIELEDEALAFKFKFEFSDYYQITVVL